jgi:hypothetical protein
MGETQVARAHGELSARQLAQGAHGPALESIMAALRLAPSLDALWAQFADVARYFNFRHPASRCATSSRARSSTRQSTPATSCDR